ncbi:MAG: rod shape-determining protein RodA [Lachnospiraceae bacterium]|nr:rod shape-determining protein RodA [Lachnospiraceae bacterium]
MISKVKNLNKKYNFKNYQFSLVILVIILSVFGAFMVGSAAPALFNLQLAGVVVGAVIMVIISLIDYSWVLKFVWVLYGINLIFLVATALFGTEVNGATRWLDLGFVQFQPSDLTKIILILFFAKFLMVREKAINTKGTLFFSIALMAPSAFLILRQPNLSNTITLIVVFCVMLYLAGLSYKFIGVLFAIVIPLAIVFLIIAIQPNQPILRDYQQNRILAWLNPEEFADAEAYQQINSVMAIGSGQLTGKGFDNDATDSLKNSNFIAEPQNDFIFAIIGEELGFLGGSFVIIMLLLIVLLCILTGIRAKDLAGRIICGGLAALIGSQTFINIAVATHIFPNTGISLPFVSYGLTSLVCFYAGIGLVLNVGLHPHKLSGKYPNKY